ncbi:Structural polyprotein [Frankliniella fusca]|uniref:Structural polyprotein n=1 Tax=Frankliniella fusca TaxID=407009 RepID=A0AAE1HDU8_9NEOP|nr:Structural polyprotein [Frankliniella fusca]
MRGDYSRVTRLDTVLSDLKLVFNEGQLAGDLRGESDEGGEIRRSVGAKAGEVSGGAAPLLQAALETGSCSACYPCNKLPAKYNREVCRSTLHQNTNEFSQDIKGKNDKG